MELPIKKINVYKTLGLLTLLDDICSIMGIADVGCLEK
jgi:hypothetical protein